MGGEGSAAAAPSCDSSYVLCVPASHRQNTWLLALDVPLPFEVHWGRALALPPVVGLAAGQERLERLEPPVQRVPGLRLAAHGPQCRDASAASPLTAASYPCWEREVSLATAYDCTTIPLPHRLLVWAYPYHSPLKNACRCLPHYSYWVPNQLWPSSPLPSLPFCLYMSMLSRSDSLATLLSLDDSTRSITALLSTANARGYFRASNPGVGENPGT